MRYRIISVFMLAFIVLSTFPLQIMAQDNRIWVTNITSSSATFIFETGKDRGWVEIDGKKYSSSVEHGVCYISVGDLAPDRVYAYTTSEGHSGTFRTLNMSSTGIPGRTIYGRVVDSLGHGISGCAVIILVKNSIPLSSKTDDEGYWIVDLSDLHTYDGEKIYIEDGESVHLIVFGGDRGHMEMDITVSGDKISVGDMELKENQKDNYEGSAMIGIFVVSSLIIVMYAIIKYRKK